MSGADIRVGLKPSYAVGFRGTYREVWEELEARHGERRWMIVADRRVLEADRSALRGLSAARRKAVVAVRGGESLKTAPAWLRLQREAAARGLDRRALIVALGGGTVGDLVGFFAATWMRGVDWIPVATTSLAMADSSVGGKTAINLDRRKNLVGAFHQPIGVYGVLAALRTLPPRHRRAGVAEVLKSGWVGDAVLHRRLERRIEDLADPEAELWGWVLQRAARVKAKVVAADAREAGGRAVLNFGHTVGHALEAVARPRPLHGEAVGLGMIAACTVAEQRGMSPQGQSDALEATLQRAGLPVRIGRPPLPALRSALSADKKNERGRLRMVLCPAPGEARYGVEVPRGDLEVAMRRIWRASGGRR